ncbi:MAG: cell envelope integrity protein TolA [Desulfobacterales bacterium]|nr:cell envelope integrity protein TolA [Desulfobacterales bacterium]
MSQTIVNVSLVALSQIQAAPDATGPASGKVAAKPLAEKAPPPPKAAPLEKPAAPKPKPAETVSLSPKKWSEKTSLKKETFKPARVVKRAIKQIEEQAEASRPSTVEAAIDRIRGKIGEKETDNRLPDNRTMAGTAEAGVGVAGPGGGDGKPAPEILVYQQDIAYHIRNNWVYPEQLAGQRKDLEARLVISIMASGEIKDVRFEKRSGDSYLDDSAYKAVLKSNPLPALPKGYQFYNVMLGFTPAGLQ